MLRYEIFINDKLYCGFNSENDFNKILNLKEGKIKIISNELISSIEINKLKMRLNSNFIFTKVDTDKNEIYFKNRKEITICGILIEPREHFALIATIYNFFNTFAKNKLYFFCGNKFYNSETRKYIQKTYENIIIYNINVDNLTYMEYNDLNKNLDLWDLIIEDYSIMVQTDGCFCSNSKYKIENFLKYDYIGGYTPYKWWWKETKGLHNYDDYQCFNGGFALKNNYAVKECLKSFPPLKSKDFYEGQDFREFNEDLYFVVCMLKLNFNVGLDEFATNYCTHTHYVKDTFCVHKLYFFLINQDDLRNEILRFLEYCPEFINNIPDEYLKFWNIRKIY
jgi:hypothetical protein